MLCKRHHETSCCAGFYTTRILQNTDIMRHSSAKQKQGRRVRLGQSHRQHPTRVRSLPQSGICMHFELFRSAKILTIYTTLRLQTNLQLLRVCCEVCILCTSSTILVAICLLIRLIVCRGPILPSRACTSCSASSCSDRSPGENKTGACRQVSFTASSWMRISRVM